MVVASHLLGGEELFCRYDDFSFLEIFHLAPVCGSKSTRILKMGKRAPEPAVEDGSQAYLKRQKISHVVSSAEDVQSSRQLKQLLAFDQDAGRAKHGKPPNPTPFSNSLLIGVSRNTIV